MARQNGEFDQLRSFLGQLFQLEEHELDFGIYRIIRLKKRFIQAFIDGEGEDSLRGTVTRALGDVRDARNEIARNWLRALADNFGTKGREYCSRFMSSPNEKNATDLRGILSLLEEDERSRAEGYMSNLLSSNTLEEKMLEERVYNYLLSFFELYYQNGDFGYNTRASAAFKVPYETEYDGADTMYHWKHRNSYYIKTGNGFHSVRFTVDGRWLEFRLTQSANDESTSSERNSNKDATFKHYRLVDITEVDENRPGGETGRSWRIRFALSATSTPKPEVYKQIWESVFGDGSDLTPYLHRKPEKGASKQGAPVFNELVDDFDKVDGGQVKGITQLRISFDKYVEEISKREEFKSAGKNAEERTASVREDPIARALWQIDRNLNRFYVGNDADYFIHKDLLGFLTREKNTFVRQAIFNDLDALLRADEHNGTLLIARAFNTVADRLIAFLAAIENFQKALFELRKKIIGTDYLISVGWIPEEFHERVLASESQREEWKELFGVGISNSKELKDHLMLVVDTALYRASDPAFVDDLLGHTAFDNLDGMIDGLLVDSENWQALNLLQDKFRETVRCIYIDPPYNTGGDGFLYKDSFRHSSWASMLYDRLELAHTLLARNGVLFASIDDKERTQLEFMLREVFGQGNRVEELIWAQNTTKGQSPTYSTNHEYVEVFARDLERAKADPAMFREPKPGFAQMMELVERLNPSYPSIEEIEQEIAALFERHRQEFREELEELGLEYEKKLDPWRGLYNYSNAEYRDHDGSYIDESKAAERQARIWIWQSDNPAFPLGGGTANKPGVYDPEHPDYRFYQPLHPVTGLPCRPPKTGWRFPKHPVEGLATSFSDLEADLRIAWGENESTIPRLKRFLHEVDTNVSKSVVMDYTDGEKQLTALLGASRTFPNPKPTTLIERFVQQATDPNDWVLDFFAGSGTTGHAVMKGEEPRRFVLVEMGRYFDSILKPRIKRVMFSTHWKDGAPVSPGQRRHMVKVQSVEQYEDLLDNLETEWDEDALPARIPVRYLFRPEENALRSTLDLSRPFSQMLKVGKNGTPRMIDLMETWCYLQGYWIKSRRMFRDFDRPYLVVETTMGTLVVFRDITDGEDDTASLQAILGTYVDAGGQSTIHRLEVNHDADLRRLPSGTHLIDAADFLRGALWS